MTPIDEIIEKLGGAAALQILLGVGPSAVSNYRLRGAFPEYARVKIWQALKARGLQVDPETLEIIGATTKVSPVDNLAIEPLVKAPSILLIISGGIAAYKALELIRRMKDKGWQVRVILTKGAQQFVTPLSVSALSGEKVYSDLFSLTDEAEMGHIRLARDADLIIVAPASANILARIAHGMTDDLATTALLATDASVLIAPAMNPFMWANQATQRNAEILQSRGFSIIGPDSGDMACGEDGAGRLSEPMDIINAAEQMLPGNRFLEGKKALVTSGPTHEPIDGVRFIANRSSGKQGHAIATALAKYGADVTLVSGPVITPPPPNIKVIPVETANEMLSASISLLPCDIAICAAAVADWSVDTNTQHKIKKVKGEVPSIQLKENPDILATISKHQLRPQLVIGFAAETQNVVAYAKEKQLRKQCDWILANDVGSDIPVFGSDQNKIHFITKEKDIAWPRMSKNEVADKLCQEIISAIT